MLGSQTITPECAGRLHLLELIVLEAMRLYPPAPNLMRRTLRPVRLGPVELGPGRHHRDPDLRHSLAPASLVRPAPLRPNAFRA